MSVEVKLVLAVCIPIAFLIILALLFKFLPRAFHSFWSQEDKIDFEIESGVMLSPEPYHMTWPTPNSKTFSPFGDDTPKAARPPQSPRVMTSLISPIKTVCSPPKRLQQGQERLQHSPLVEPGTFVRL
ncbi:hypothetical protein P3T76_004771 [Phytophthora citrophthora]|uniref:Uncharacterized protein n=1 Tax=Phytophthora citrophthora TaxID=4793 RepID=A0AAD9GRH2_9STRA|nr:hypothetical protein P3T76_004771 [Phytophthora citrophthora]